MSEERSQTRISGSDIRSGGRAFQPETQKQRRQTWFWEKIAAGDITQAVLDYQRKHYKSYKWSPYLLSVIKERGLSA